MTREEDILDMGEWMLVRLPSDVLDRGWWMRARSSLESWGMVPLKRGKWSFFVVFGASSIGSSVVVELASPLECLPFPCLG